MPDQQTTTQSDSNQTDQQSKSGQFTQQDVDRIVQDRLARERAKFQDYEDLVRFKSEHQKQAEAQQQKALEEQKEYEKIKEQYESKIGQLTDIVSKKDSAIRDLHISTALTGEITKQNGYLDEALAMLKSQTVLTEDGKVMVKGKDSNGIDTQLSIKDGVEQFLKQRPYLVKASASQGSGMGSTGAPQSPGSGMTLNDLNSQLYEAHSRGDYKKAAEIKKQIQGDFSARGITRSV